MRGVDDITECCTVHEEVRKVKSKDAQEFSDLKHSVHVFDAEGNRLADIDENGVKLYSNVKIAVYKKTGEDEGWPKLETIYMSDGLKKLVKAKIEPDDSIPCSNMDMG